MKQSIFRIGLLTCFLVFSSFGKPEKVKYSSEEGKLTVVFPAQYTSEINETETYTTHKIKAEFDGLLYFFSYQVHKQTMTDHEEMAKLSLDSFAETIKGKIENEETWKIKKNKGLKADITSEKNNMKIQYKVILIGQMQYQIVVASDPSNWNQKNVDKFFRSFKIKN